MKQFHPRSRVGRRPLVLVIFALFAACGDAGDEDPIEAGGLEPGHYDLYGTFADNPEYADGTGSCAIPQPVSVMVTRI